MRTLVIGGSRNLGPTLVQALAARGDEVTVLNRGISRPVASASDSVAAQHAGRPLTHARAGAGAGTGAGAGAEAEAEAVTHLVADRSDRDQLRAALEGRTFDLVVDTTLYTGPQAELAVELLNGRVGRFVWWSTGQVYLVRTGLRRPFREADYDGPIMPEPASPLPGGAAASHDNSPVPDSRAGSLASGPLPGGSPDSLDHRNWLYGVAKRAAEDVLRTAHAARGFPAVSLRMPMIASERDHYTRIAAYVRRLYDGGPILIPEDAPLPVRHVYGGDVIAATLRAAEAEGTAGGAFNISQDETLEFTEMVHRIGALLDRTPHFAQLPRATLEAHSLLPGCSPFSDPWMSSLDNALSKHALGMRYTAVDVYLPRCVKAALAVPVASVVGYERREEEVELAREEGG